MIILRACVRVCVDNKTRRATPCLLVQGAAATVRYYIRIILIQKKRDNDNHDDNSKQNIDRNFIYYPKVQLNQGA